MNPRGAAVGGRSCQRMAAHDDEMRSLSAKMEDLRRARTFLDENRDGFTEEELRALRAVLVGIRSSPRTIPRSQLLRSEITEQSRGDQVSADRRVAAVRPGFRILRGPGKRNRGIAALR